ncbi:MAG: T9SS type B sorting domain-containing protein [Bacteroidia bacterium]
MLFTYLSLVAFAFKGDTPSYVNYIKNKGQWNANVLYQADFRGGRLFLEKNAFTYIFYPQDGLRRLHPHQKTAQTNNQKSIEDITLNFHTVRMEFVGSTTANTNQLNVKPFYHNYFLGKDPKNWANKVPIGDGVNYNDLYNGISLKTFSSGNNVRYDFTVNPSSNAALIKMKFTGQDKLTVHDGKLIIGTSVADIIQEAPYAYQEIDGKEVKVNCKYVLKDNIVSIEVAENYNHNKPLIIDPTLVFATFTGSTADNWGMTASYDNQGNGYTAGICFGVGYPLTAGAFQQAFHGGVTNATYTYAGFDIVTSKFDQTGANLLFSTYLGGTDNDEPESIIVDNGDNLLILGRSYSADFPVTAGAYDVSLNGGADIIVTKFNSTGTGLIASTFVGGNADDGVNFSGSEATLGSLKYNYADDGRGDLILDNSNNVYVASCTQSTDFPVTVGCAQASNGGMQDGCVFKLNATLSSLVWSTYLGGTANDAAYNLAVDNSGSAFVTGGTESSNFPVTAGALHSTYMGNIDGFLTHVSNSGNAFLQSTYIGTAGYDQSYFVQLDNLNHVYIYGQTSGGYPVTAGVYSNPNSGQFIHEFSSNLSATIFSTVFGTGQGAPDIAPSAFLVDKCNNIYISGWGGTLGSYNIASSTTNGLPVTSNAFQPTTDGEDFYFMVLQPGASALWYATYFGGDVGSEEHVDGGTSRFDKSGVIYQAICEGCAVDPRTNYSPNSDMPTTPTAWSTTDKSFNCNNALVKFSFNLLQTVANLSISPSTAAGCAPFSVSFTNQSQNASHFNWFFGDGDTSTSVNATHIYTVPGTYTVALAAKDTATCNVLDTMLAVITVYALPIVTATSDTVCKGTATTLTAGGATTYTWSTGSNATNITQTPSVTTQYTVSGSKNGCANTATASILVNPLPVVTVNNDTICIGATTSLTAAGAVTYTWNTGNTTPSITETPTTTTHYTVTGTDANLCKNKAIASITVNPLPVISVNNPAICIGHIATLTAGNASTYTWSTNDTTAIIIQSPTVTTHYTVTGTNSNGCVNTKTATVTVNPLPIVSVNSDTICSGNPASLTATGAISYVWSTGNTGANYTPWPMVQTNYTVTGTDLHSCVNTATTSVYVNISPTVTVNNPTICRGDIATLTAGGASTYTWSSHDTTVTITTQPYATTTYTVWGSNAICTASTISTVTVLVNNTHITTNGALGICIGDSMKLSTTLTYTNYIWSTGQQTQSIEVTQAGLYTVHTIDNNGCKGMDTIKVLADSPVALPMHDSTICSGNTVHLQVTQGNYIYQWAPGASLNHDNIYNPIANPTSTTVYTVVVTNGVCVNTNTVTVFVNPSPTINVNPKYSLVTQGESVFIHANSSDTCYWSPSDYLSCTTCNTTMCIPDADITYTITANNSQGCSTIVTATVDIKIEYTFYIPNTFTPNRDETNEIFKPLATHIHDFKMDIFDRWGLLLFETNDLEHGWDGTYKGGRCQEDVYVYKVEFVDDPSNKTHTKAGIVNIVR